MSSIMLIRQAVYTHLREFAEGREWMISPRIQGYMLTGQTDDAWITCDGLTIQMSFHETGQGTSVDLCEPDAIEKVEAILISALSRPKRA